MARNKRIHDVTPRDTLDRAAFVLAFLFGAGGGVILKLLGAHPLVSATYAAVILILYAIVAWAGGRIKIEPETIGDNCYYLGFLFTLSSLAYTLYQMADPTLNGGRAVDIPEVISGFGVALSSTIFGVFLRVLMMQLRPDFVAKDREVRADINRAFEDFRKNMSGMLSQMKAYSAESVQIASERDARIRANTEEFVNDHQEALKANADFLSSHMKEAFSGASKKAIEDISAALVSSQEAHKERLDGLGKEILAIKSRLAEQEADTIGDIQDRRVKLSKELEFAESQLKSHREEIKANARALRSAADAINKKLIPALEALEKRADAAIPARDASFAEGEAEAIAEPSRLRARRPWRTRSSSSE